MHEKSLGQVLFGKVGEVQELGHRSEGDLSFLSTSTAVAAAWVDVKLRFVEDRPSCEYVGSPPPEAADLEMTNAAMDGILRLL
jgi:hypothetical protein